MAACAVRSLLSVLSSSRIGVYAETGFRLPRVVRCLHFCCRRWKCACTNSRMLRFVLDAKWKHTGKNENKSIGDIDGGDLCQRYAYGKRYKCQIVPLVYPKTLSIHGPSGYSTT
ncbi:MAG: hypothetical protein F4Y90_08310 [Rhodothermaceae bacterium]|nr:hypothetical protein [Rhodothermaceae bacterium]MYF41369.1 hypothetical protein [Rhodothermaceae bacterium]